MIALVTIETKEEKNTPGFDEPVVTDLKISSKKNQTLRHLLFQLLVDVVLRALIPSILLL